MFQSKYHAYQTVPTYDVESHVINSSHNAVPKSNKWKYSLAIFLSTLILVYFSFGWLTQVISGASGKIIL